MSIEKPSKTFKRIKKQRQEEFLPPVDPTQPYKRNFEKTRMSWPVALLYSRDKNATHLLIFLILFLGIIIIIVGYLGWLFLKWFLDVLPMVIAT